MNTKNILISALVAVVVALGVNFFVHPTTKEVTRETVKEIGAFPGPDFQANRFTFNDSARLSFHNRLGASWAGTEGTTTACSVRGPLDATSTPSIFNVFMGANATATFLGWGIGTTPTATDTLTIIGTFGSTAAAEQKSIVGSTSITGATAFTDPIIPPGQYLNLKIAGGTNGTQRPVGSCDVELVELRRN